MQMQTLHRRAFAFLASVALMAFSAWAGADPPSRVARLGYASAAVSFSPAGENDWVQATINRPLGTGDRLWSDAGARAEIQVGGAMIRMSANTSVGILNLDDRIAQLQLTQGTLSVRVRRVEPGQAFEVDTPNLAFTLRQPGAYRIEVDPDGNATTIVVRQGQGEVYGEAASYVIDSRQPYRFTGTGLREYQYVDAPRLDAFDRWSGDRDRAFDNSASARYVSQDVVGYQDLDAYGSWRVDAGYGNVWFPNRVAVGWAPYRDGHWAWIDPWGWTWVDDAPWGFAVSHYGRWANLQGTWGWVPGPVRTRAYYAPALVVFVGGDNFQLTISSGNVGGVAWFPLGPREVYRPSYPVSRGYFENINQSNTVVNTTIINNVYNNSNVTNIVYANRQVPGAVIAVPTTAFAQSQPVSKAAVRVTQETMASAPVAVVPHVAPTQKSVRGAAAEGDKPPARVFERPVVARTEPPAAPVGFAAQQPQLAAKPGHPLDEVVRKELKPAAAAPLPVVKMVAPTQSAPQAMPAPPAVDPAGQAPEQRGKPEKQHGRLLAAPDAAPPQAAPAPPAAPPPEERAEPEQRGKGAQHGQPPPLPSQDVMQPKAAPPQVTPAPPAAPPPEERAKPEQRGRGAQHEQPPPPPPQDVGQPKAAPPPQVVQPAPAPQQPAQRGKPEPGSDARSPEPRAPDAGARAPASRAQPQPAQTAEPRGRGPKPAASAPGDRKKEGNEKARGEEDRKHGE